MPETEILTNFIQNVRDVFKETNNPTVQAERVAELTTAVLSEEDWLEMELESQGVDQARMVTLYVDDEFGTPEPGFRITAGRLSPENDPARKNLAHDHGLAWVIYGTYSGEREQTIYNWVFDETGIPHLEATDHFAQQKGDLIIVPPGQIHRQQTVGNEDSINFRVESLDMSSRPRYWYKVEEGLAEASVKHSLV